MVCPHPAPPRAWMPFREPVSVSSLGRGAGGPHPSPSCTRREGTSDSGPSLRASSLESWGICADRDHHPHIPGDPSGPCW